MGGTFFRGARTVGGRPCIMRPTVNCGMPSSWGLATCRRAWRRRQGGCGWSLWTRLRRVGVSAASLDGPRTSTAQWATAGSRSTARIGRQLGRRRARGRAHFLAPRCRVRVGTTGTSRRRRREVGCRRAEGPSVKLLALPADCFGPRRWIVEDEAWRWRMGLGVREQ